MYAGIDPSTFTALSLISREGDVRGSTLFNFPRQTGVRRAQLIARACLQHLAEARVEVVAIEGFAFNNHNTLVTLSEISTLIKSALLDLGIPWWEVPPTVLKKWVTGKGNAKKEDMAAAVKERWGYVPTEKKGDDLVDSYALAKLCWMLEHGKTEEVEGLQKKCVYVPKTA